MIQCYLIHKSFKAVKTLFHDNGIRFETTGIGVSVLAGTGNTATIAGPQFLILDPDGVGVNTGVVRIKGDLIVEGEQTISSLLNLRLQTLLLVLQAQQPQMHLQMVLDLRLVLIIHYYMNIIVEQIHHSNQVRIKRCDW